MYEYDGGGAARNGELEMGLDSICVYECFGVLWQFFGISTFIALKTAE
jgi:hypothetical protein